MSALLPPEFTPRSESQRPRDEQLDAAVERSTEVCRFGAGRRVSAELADFDTAGVDAGGDQSGANGIYTAAGEIVVLALGQIGVAVEADVDRRIGLEPCDELRDLLLAPLAELGALGVE